MTTGSQLHGARWSGMGPSVIIIYLFIMKSYMSTQKIQRKIKTKQMNKELDYDTHNDSIIRSMSAAPKIESTA